MDYIDACINKDPCIRVNKGKSLYLDIQSIRIDMVDKQSTDNFNYYFNMFNYGFNTCIGFLTFRYLYSDVYRSIETRTLGFFRYISSGFNNRIDSVSKVS